MRPVSRRTIEQRGARKPLAHAEVGDRRAPPRGARGHHVAPRAIAPERRVDRARRGVGMPRHERDVAALDLAPREHRHQLGVRLLRLRHHEQARGVAVEPVHDPGPLRIVAARRAAAQRLRERGPRVPGRRVDHQARRACPPPSGPRPRRPPRTPRPPARAALAAGSSTVTTSPARHAVALGPLRAPSTVTQAGVDQPLCGRARRRRRPCAARNASRRVPASAAPAVSSTRLVALPSPPPTAAAAPRRRCSCRPR